MSAFAAIGCAIAGIVSFDNLSKSVSSESIAPEMIVAIMLLILSCLFAIMGAPLVLKIYYIHKLNLQGISFDD